MAFQLPDVKQLQQLAKQLSFSLDEAQAEQMLGYMQGFAEGYQYLDETADCLPAIDPKSREYYRPTAEDNALGAWYVKCEVSRGVEGPLKGKRLAVKDNIFMAGLPFSAGSSILADYIADYDATVVERVLAAGGEIAGKSACEYFCLSGGSCTSHSGMTQNPRKAGYSTGGSSSGSAALVVAGEVDMALGTDQGGSVRIPSSWTGCYGMKATIDVVPYTGGMAMETSIDYIGPLTRDVADNALLLEVLANREPGSFTAGLGETIDGIKIGVVKEGFGHPSGEAVVDECVRQAAAELQKLGAAVDEVSIPMHPAGVGIWGAVVTDGLWQSLMLNGLGYNYEGYYSPSLHEAMANAAARSGEMPVNGRLLMLLGKHMEQYHGKYYARAKNQVHALRAAYDSVLEEYDLLLMPTTVRRSGPNPPSLAAEHNDAVMVSSFGNTFNTCQFNSTGHPAMSLPCALRDDLPVGLMLVGRYRDEGLIYRVAHAYEQNVDWQRA